MPQDHHPAAPPAGGDDIGRRAGALISGRTIQGTPVYNPAGDHLGHIDDVVIDAASGRVVYGILQFGGFLGIGSDFYPIPFGKLTHDRERGGYVTDLTREQLDTAPRPDPDWHSDIDWQRRAYDHYGVPPYWF